MVIVSSDDAAVLTPETTDNNGTVQLSREEIRRAASFRFRESRRMRRQNSRAAATNNPLVFRPIAVRPSPQPPQVPLPREFNPMVTTPLFEKQLQNSDVNVAGRILIPKRLAETYLPYLTEKDGLFMYFYDVDFMLVWTFKFRFWPNTHGRIYLLESTKNFIRMHGLMAGDYIIIYRDSTNGQYLVGARKQASRVPLFQPTADNDSNPELLQSQAEIGNILFPNQEDQSSEINGPDQNFQTDIFDEEMLDYELLVRTPHNQSLNFLSPFSGE